MSRIGASMTSLGSQLTVLTSPLMNFGSEGLNVAADFDSSMRQISARTGIVGADLDAIRETALQMGADTAFSAQQAADAFLELLSSGQSAEDALATLPSVLDAAAASGADLGSAADDVTNILASFRLPANSARRVVNALSRAANSSSADMGDLGQAFANVGGIAADFGLSVDDTAAIFAVFAENGIKGAEAGTQLRSMLQNMARNTDDVADAWDMFGSSLYDAQGNMRSLPVVLNEIEAAAANMTDQQRQQAFMSLAGSYGILGLTALTAGGDIGQMLGAMEGSASAADVAGARMGGWQGATDALRGSIETLQIRALTPLMDNVLTPLLNDHITPLINKVSDWAAENPQLAGTIIAVGAAASIGGIALAGLGAVISGLGVIIGGVLTVGLGPLGIGIALVGGLIAAYMTNFLGFKDWVDDLGERLRIAAADVGALIGQIRNLGLELDNVFRVGGPWELIFQDPNQGPLMQYLGGGGSTNTIPPITGIPGFASGGFIGAGRMAWVGEAGPELFVPGRSGQIVPNDQLGGVVIESIVVQANGLSYAEAEQMTVNAIHRAFTGRRK